MCIDATESATNPLSSGLRVDGASRHQFSEGEKNAVLSFSFNLRKFFGHASTQLHGHIALAFPSLLEANPQILEHWVALMKITWAKDSKRWFGSRLLA